MEYLPHGNIATVIQQLQDTTSVLVRAAFTNQEATWNLNTLAIDGFPYPLQEPYPSYCYNYGRYAFCSGEVSGAEASSWLQRQQGQVQGLAFQVPQLQQETQIGKYPSHAPASEFSTPVPWPYMRFEITIRSDSTSAQQDQGFLISEGCPFFPNFKTALYALLYGHTTAWDRAQQQVQGGKILIRLAQTDAWIERVHIAPASLSIQIAGSQLHSTFLQVQAPPYPAFEQAIRESSTIDYPLPDGIPGQVWITVSRDHTWLDHLVLDQRWSPFAAQHTNISAEPPDMATQIQATIAQGEGPTIEFKEDTPDDRDKMLKTMAAFANGNGGVILLGVKNGTGELTGLREDAGRKKDGIQNMIRNSLVPEIQVHYEVTDIEHRTILAIYVAKGSVPPYGLNQTRPAYYVRRGATTFPARQDEVRALARAGIPLRALSPSGIL